MALTEENGGNGMVMPVAPMYGGGGSGFGGWGGDSGWWIILLFLFALGGGWGNGFGGGAGMGGFAADGAVIYPWMNQSNQITDGFRDQMINDNVTSIRDGVHGISTQLCSGFGDVQQSLCNGFAGVNATVNAGFANAETANNARQMASMQQAFAMQTAMGQGFNQLGSQLADCCCENRLASADLKYTIATENCADRTQAMQNTRNIIDSQNRGTQAIIDKLCQLELDGVKAQLAQAERENIGLQNQLNMATVQNGMNAEVDALYNRLKNCPVPSMPVYGTTPIFTCGSNNGVGCGCGGSF